MQRLQQGATPSQDSEKEPTCTKIFYASRTHSQLSQVLHELKKLRLKLNVAVPSAEQSPPDDARTSKRPASTIDQPDDPDVEGTGPRAISLGSRKQLCIYERLREKAADLDEACRQMLGGGYAVLVSMSSTDQDRSSREREETMSTSSYGGRRVPNARLA